MTKTQKQIINLFRTIHELPSWSQLDFYDRNDTREFPNVCGTNCCVAGHLINQFATDEEKEETLVGKPDYAMIAAGILAREFNLEVDTASTIHLLYRVPLYDGGEEVARTPFNGGAKEAEFQKFANFLESRVKTRKSKSKSKSKTNEQVEENTNEQINQK